MSRILTKDKSGRTRKVCLILLAACAVIFCFIFIYFANLRQKVFMVKGSLKEVERPGVCLAGGRTKEWDEPKLLPYNKGMEYDFVLKNPLKNNIYNWRVDVAFDADFDIDSSWNGEFKKTDHMLSFSPEERYETVYRESEQTWGLVMMTRDDQDAAEYRISYQVDTTVKDSRLFWVTLAVTLLTLTVLITSEISNIRYRKLQERQDEIQSILLESFETFARIIDAKDPYTQGHSMRVALYAKMIAAEMGYSPDDQDRVYWIGMLHDIGKIGVTDLILQKPGRLDNMEYTMIQTHVDIGGKILEDFNALPGIAEGARYHHERWDGKGYSTHLSGKQIPEIARIICLADSFDAMTSPRVYRKALPVEHARQEIINCSGTQFDPDIAPIIIKLIDEGKIPVEIKE